jgi:hypothetical protein
VFNLELKVGSPHKCPEGHKAKIVWISEDKKTLGVKCSFKHLKKIVKNKKTYDQNMVFFIKI